VTVAADDGSGAGVTVAAEDGSGAGVTEAVEGGLGAGVTAAEEDGWGAGVTGAEEDGGSGAGVGDAEADVLSAGVTEAEEEETAEASEGDAGTGRRAVLVGLIGVGVSGRRRRRLVTSPSGAAFRCRLVAPGFGLVGAAGAGDGVAAALVERLIGISPRVAGNGSWGWVWVCCGGFGGEDGGEDWLRTSGNGK